MDNHPSASSGDSKAERIRTRYDLGSTDVSTAVVEATSIALDKSRTDLPPLYSYVDSDALDALFSDRTGSADENFLRVTFPYRGFQVTVVDDGQIIVDPQRV